MRLLIRLLAAAEVPLRERWWRAALALLLATLCAPHLLHACQAPSVDAWRAPDKGGALPPKAEALLKRQLKLWRAAAGSDIPRMRRTNPEWDFMARTFVVLALANVAMRDAGRRGECLEAMDAIITDTLRAEEQLGQAHFLMGYAGAKPWVRTPPRSLFIDGEVAMMLAARRLVEERDEHRSALRERARWLAESLTLSDGLICGESYPDECWTFCNATALAALRMHDALDGSDHQELASRWIAMARGRLVDGKTGLLHSAFTVDGGRILHGPEGSSTWMVAHALTLVDPDFARDQYQRSKRELVGDVAGFAYAREWPRSWPHRQPDVDSGPIIPIVEASAGSSGLAVLGASAFGDRELLGELLASLMLFGFPLHDQQGTLRFVASNQVGDAVLLYALVQGPLWSEVRNRLAAAKKGGGR